MHGRARWIGPGKESSWDSRLTVSRDDTKLKVAQPAIGKHTQRVRTLTGRSRSRRLVDIITKLRESLLGCKAYVGITEVVSPQREIDNRTAAYVPRMHGAVGGRSRKVSFYPATHRIALAVSRADQKRKVT